MGDFVERYKDKRQRRLEERFGVDVDTVGEFKKRRKKRLEDRGFRLDYGADEPAAWITVRGNHIPVDEEGKPVGGQKKALGGGKVGEKKEEVIKSKNPVSSHYKEKSPEGFVDNWNPPVVKGMDDAKVRKVLSKCEKIGGKHYDKGTEVAKDKRNTHLWTYTSHGLDHVQQVIDKTNEAADAIDLLPDNTFLGGANIDRPTILVSSWFHDTGMDGDAVDWEHLEVEKGGKKKVISDDGNELRKAHGVNSAIHVLEHANELKKMGVDPNKVAMIVYSHTKSMSGVGDLKSPEDWKIGLERLEKAANDYSARTGVKVKFDRSAVFGGEPDAKNIRDVAAMVAAIRLGDANREAQGPLRSQSGGEYKIEKMPDARFNSAKKEAKGAEISITEDGEKHMLDFSDKKMSQNPGHPYSKMVVLGERNLNQMSVGYSKQHRTLQEEVELADGNAVPWSTVEALLERCGELNTINGVPRAIKIKMTGVNSWKDMSPQAEKAYKAMWQRIQHEKDKKTGKLKYSGVENLVLVFDNGDKHASKYDFELRNRGNMK